MKSSVQLRAGLSAVALGAAVFGSALMSTRPLAAQDQPTPPAAQEQAVRPGPGGSPAGGRAPVLRMQQPGGSLPPGFQPPGGQLPGRRPPPPRSPAAPPAPVEHGGAGAGHGEGHHCPGHGPNDPPAHINWYQGLLGVNNEKSQSASGVDRLLWRYHNEKDECDPKNQDPPLLAAVINFAVVLLVVFKFGKGPVMEALAKRKQTIMQDIDSANTLRIDAESRLESYKDQLAKLEDRRKEVRDEFRAQWEQEKKRILEEAAEKAARLRKDAEFRVAQELKQARADLLGASVESAVVAAREILAKRIQPADLDRLAEDYVSHVGSALKSSSRSTNASRSPA
jgi:F-type H+-transporting ATPase subunit b